MKSFNCSFHYADKDLPLNLKPELFSNISLSENKPKTLRTALLFANGMKKLSLMNYDLSVKAVILYL